MERSTSSKGVCHYLPDSVHKCLYRSERQRVFCSVLCRKKWVLCSGKLKSRQALLWRIESNEESSVARKLKDLKCKEEEAGGWEVMKAKVSKYKHDEA